MKKYYFFLTMLIMTSLGLTAQDLLAPQDFEGGMPTGWSTEAPAATAWAVGDNLGSIGFPIPAHTSYAVSNDNACGVCDLSEDVLITDVVSFGTLTGVFLTFDAFLPSPYSQYGLDDSKGYVYVRPATGGAWVLAYTIPINAAWQTYTVSLDGVVSGDMEVGFAHDDMGANATGLAIDNVHIYAQYPNDLKIVSLDAPAAGCINEMVDVTITVQNVGQNQITGFTASYSVDGSSISDETVSGLALNSNDTYQYTFTTQASLAIGAHMFNVMLGTDDNTANNSFASAIEVVRNGALPVPYTEDFVNNESFYWNLENGLGSDAIYTNGMVEMSGIIPTYANWVGDISTTTEANAWNDNTEFHSSVVLTCNANSVAANTENLELVLDLRQETQLSLVYSWFAVYVNDTRVSDVNGMDSFNPATPSSDDWTTLTYNLSSFNNGSPIKIELRACTHHDADKVYIDNVIVRQRNEADAGVLSIISPVSDCGLTATNDLTVIVKNYGVEAISNVPVYYQVDNGITVLAGLVNSTIQVGSQSAPYTFSGLAMAGLETEGAHTVKVYTQLADDVYHPENDDMTITVVNLPIIGSFPYEQDFESATYWAAGGTNSSWELGVPAGTPTAVITPNVDGANSWVTNLTGAYNYNETSYLQGPCFDFSALTEPYIEFDIYYHTDANTDGAQLQVSIGGGAWTRVGDIIVPAIGDPIPWYNNAVSSLGGSEVGFTDNSNGWTTVTHSLAAYIGQSEVSFRFVFASDGDNLGGGNPQTEQYYEGIAIDNIFIGEPHADWDLKAVDWVSPVSGYLLTNAEVVTIEVENLGVNDITSFFAAYSIDGGTTYTTPEEFTVSILAGASTTISFTDVADMEAWGTYNCIAVVDLLNDENITNDEVSIEVQSVPIISSFPYNEDFQNSNHFWEVDGTNVSWQYGIPGGTTIPVDPNDIATDLAWVTNLTGNYNNNEFSWVESPIFDFSGLFQPAISMNIAFDAEGNTPDGANLQYSIAGGAWTTLGTIAPVGNPLNWYVNNIDGLNGEPGWTTYSGGWVLAEQDMTILGGLPSVKLRVLFGSDASQTQEGMAFDDVMIFENAPHDLALTAWSSQATGCGLTNAEVVSLEIENTGFFEEAGFTVQYSIELNGSVIDTQSEVVAAPLASGATLSFDFALPTDFSVAGLYTCTAEVILAGDVEPTNNEVSKQVVSSPSVNAFPYMQDFETGNAGWLVLGNSSFEVGVPDPGNSVINSAASGNNAFVTNLDGEYSANEAGWVESPCFNFALMDTPAIQFSYIGEMEYYPSLPGFAFDGAALGYSLDGGQTWSKVGAVGDTTNWYNFDQIWNIQHGWSGIIPNWTNAGIRMPYLSGETNVKFRFRFRSDNINTSIANADGFGFDNILIFNDVNFAGDAGVVDVTLENGCEFSTGHLVGIEFTNFHPDSTMYAGEVVNVAYSYDGGPAVSESVVLATDVAPGGSYTYTFATPLDYAGAGNIGITAYTQLVNDIDPSNNAWTELIDVYATPVIGAATITDIDCAGAATGAIDLPTENYTYLWNTGATSEDLLAIVAGTYTVEVTDLNSCVNSQSYTVNEPAALTLAFAVTNNNCYDDMTAVIDATVGGGTAPYIYNWSNGESTASISGLASGSYSLLVTDDNGCTIAGVEVVNPEGAFEATIATTNAITCTDDTDGALQVNVTGGTAPYTYAWSDIATNVATRSALPAGDYSVIVSDANGCFAGGVVQATTYTWDYTISPSSQHTIAVPATLNLTIDAAVVTINPGDEYLLGVFYDNNGSLECGGYIQYDGAFNALTAWGEASPVNGFNLGETFVWKIRLPDGTTIDATAIYETPPGTASLTDEGDFSNGGLSLITDLAGVSNAATGNLISTTLANPTPMAVTFNVSNNNGYEVSCNGGADGGVVAEVSGGTAPYSYQWVGGPVTQDYQGLIAGDYVVNVSDANACSTSAQVTITEPMTIAISFTKTDVSCNGLADGAANTTVTGGVAPFTYNWSDVGPLGADRVNLFAGDYTVTVTDVNSCTAEATVTIVEPYALPLVQDFELGTLPTDWSRTQNASSVGWEFGSDLNSSNPFSSFAIPAHSGYAASNDDAHDDFAGTLNIATDDYLISPVFDISGYASVDLQFDAFYDNAVGTATVEISVDGGPWMVVETLSASGAWQEDVVVSLSNYVGACQVQVAFHYNDNGVWAAGFAIDNVNIDGALQYAHDLAIVSWVEPMAYSCMLTDAETVKMSITNIGLNTATGFTLAYTVNGTTITPETYAAVINVGETVEYSFTTPADLLAEGDYNFSAEIVYVADGDLTNNTITGIVVTHYPNINTFAYTEDFEGAMIMDFTTVAGAQATSTVGMNGGSNAYTVAGINPSIGWSGGATPTATQAWVTNAAHVVSLETYCPVDATGLSSLELVFDLQQTFANSTLNNWFRVLVDGVEVYMNNPTTQSDPIAEVIIDLDAYAGSTFDLAFQFSSRSAGDLTYLDNVVLREKLVDVATIAIVSPTAACELTATEAIVVEFENLGGLPVSNFDIEIDVDGTVTTHTVGVTINPGATVQYTVTGGITADLSALGAHVISVDANATTDANTSNDVATANIFATPYYNTYPFLESAANFGTYWMADGTNSSWEFDVDTWYTGLAGNHNNDEVSYVMSPCFDFSVLNNPIVEFDIAYNTEFNADGVVLQYSNNGTTWTTIGAPGDIENWYNGPNSWTGNSNGVMTVRHALVGLSGDVQFRLYFTADNSTVQDGIQFSNFAIFEMPDVGAVATSPLTVCAESNFNVGIEVMNYSLVEIASGTDVVLEYSIDGGAVVTETVQLTAALAAGSSVVLNATATEAIAVGGTYTLDASATISGDLNTANNAFAGSVMVYTLPVVDAGIDQTICNGDPAVTLVATGAVTYEWNTLETTASIMVSPAVTTTYTVVGTDANMCSVSADVTVNVNDLPNVDAGLAQTVCFGESLTLTATGAATYVWSNGDLTAATTFVVTADGTYTVTGTDMNGCSADASVNVTVNALPVTTITSDLAVCFGETATLTATGGDAYLWNTTETTASITVAPIQNTTYSVTITDNTTTCSSVEDVVVSVTNGPQASEVIVHNNCFDGTDGSIALTITSTGLTTIAWDGGETTASISGLAAGFYTVTVTDQTGAQCAFVETYEVSQPIVPITALVIDVANYTGYSISCNGAADGELLAVATSGTLPYTYAWSDAGASSTAGIANLGPDTYTVSVTDVNGCTATGSFTVTEPAVLSSTISATDITCYGMTVPNGTVSLVPAGGTPSYTYLWSNGATTKNLVDVVEGTYEVTITDANSCTATQSIFVDEPAQLMVNSNISDYNGYQISCFGSADGYFAVNPTGGIAPYTYLWNNGFTGDSIGDISTYSTYSVVVTDANGCTASASQLMTYPQIISIQTLGVNDISCFGLVDGSINIPAVYNGVPPFTYSWTDGGAFSATTQNISGLAAGTYTVVVTDMNGCTATSSGQIIEPASISAAVDISSALVYGGAHVTCPGAADGELTAMVTGGTSPFTYLWSDENSSMTEVVTGLAAGAYSVTVTDASGCSAVGSTTIVDPTAVSATTVVTSSYGAQATELSCFDSADGIAEVTPAGGTAPYTYDWGIYGTDAIATGLPAGTHSVTVYDFNNCSFVATVTLTPPAEIIVDAHVTTEVSCTGQDDAVIEVAASGGIGTLTYMWSDGLGTAASATGISAGTYTVSVTDENGCVVVGTVNVVDPNPVVVSIQVTSDYNGFDISCFGASTGSLLAVASGGTGNYTYQWSGQTITTADIDALPEGAYSVTATDDNGCWSNAFKIITGPTEMADAATIISDINGYNVTCNGINDGSIDLVVDGGVAPYTYLWSNNGETTSLVSGLAPGTHSVTVTDFNNCEKVFTYNLTEPPAMYGDFVTSDFNGFNVSCFGGSNGSFAMTVVNGAAPYTYLWSNDSVTASQSNLMAGQYDVTITDQLGCVAYDMVTLTEPALFEVDQIVQTATYFTQYGVSCNGSTDGAVDLTLSNGLAPFTYLWSNGSTMEDPADLPGGVSTVQITDLNGCVANGTITLAEPDPVAGMIDITSQALYNGADVSCNGAADGMVSLTVQTGHSPFTYAWSNGETTADLSGLAAGTYTVTITDAHNCIGVETVTIVEPDPLAFTVTQTNVDCNGNATGMIDVTVTGGTGNYIYFWSDGTTMEDASNLTPGFYYFLVLDANWCYLVSDVYEITEPAPLVANASVSSASMYDGYGVSCNGAADGTVELVVGGGTAPYTYSWSNGESTEDLAGLAAGSYDVTVTDFNGCVANASVVVTEPAIFAAVAVERDAVSCNGLADGVAEVVTTNGFAPFSYNWDNGGTTELVSGLAAGTYMVTVTDAHMCSATASVTITEPVVLAVALASSTPFNGFNVSCYDAIDGTITSTVTGGVAPFTYAWTNLETTGDISNAPVGDNTVIVTDANGCTATATITLTAPDMFSATLAVTSDYNGSHISCTGAMDASLAVTPAGGLTPYTYLWDYMGMTTDVLANVGAGDYIVTVTDANNCEIVDTVTVVDPGEIEITINAQDITCFGANDGTIDVTAVGGTAPYSYYWNTGATTSSLDNLSEGTYYLFVVDANLCYSAMYPVSIVEPSNSFVALGGSSINVSCFGETDGGVNTYPSGGNPPYQFEWTDDLGAVIATSQNLTNVGAGVYHLTVWDAFQCHSIGQTFTVNQPDLLVVEDTVSSYNGYGVSCNGLQDGEITITIAGGTTPYAIVWDNEGNSTTATVSNLSPGTYNVTVTDAEGCNVINTYTITEPTAVQITASTITNVDCYGANTGAVDIVVDGGLAPYTFAWTGGETTQNIAAVLAGTHEVVVTDTNGCTYTESFTIVENPEFIAGEVITDVTCSGALNGSIVLSPVGGVGPYTYAWSNGSSDMDQVGLAGGTYTVNVTDASACTYIFNYDVFEPQLLAAVATTVTTVSCNGAADGAIDLTVSGGTAPYVISWSNGASSEDLSAISGGDYTVDVLDANGCTAQLMVNVYEPDAIVINPLVTEVSCNNDMDGAIALDITGGVLPYYYTWSNGSLDPTVSGLGAGTYTVTVTSIHNNIACTEVATVTLVNPDVLTFVNSVSEITCNGGNDGMIDITISGGTAPYTTVWSDGSTNEDLMNATAGSYTVNISDAHGCAISNNLMVPWAYSNTGVSHTILVQNVAIDGAPLAIGDYIGVFYTDSSTMQLACGGYIQWTGGASSAISAWGAETDINGQSLYNGFSTLGEDFMWKVWRAADGSVVDMTPTYGPFPNAATFAPNGISGLTDLSATGAPAIATVGSGNWTLTEPAAIEITANITDALCFGSADGIIDISVANAFAPVTYSWSTGNTTEDESGLVADSYMVTVTDVNGCTATETFIVGEPDELAATANTSDITCNGANDGSVDVIVTGGTPLYTYEWLYNPAISLDWDYTNTGTNHTVVISGSTAITLNGSPIEVGDVIGLFYDSLGTQVCAGYVVWDGSNTNIAAWGTEVDLVSGASLNNGFVTGEAFTWKIWQASTGLVFDANSTYSAGFPASGTYITDGVSSVETLTAVMTYTPFTATTPTVSGLTAGSYQVVITDANGCETSLVVEVVEPDPIVVQTTMSDYNGFNVSTCGATDAWIGLTVSGGVAPYTYLWSDGQTADMAVGLDSGMVSVVITDASMCTQTIEFNMTVLCNPVVVACVATDVTCANNNDGEVNITVTGGMAPFTYAWNNGATTENLIGVTAGTYEVTVTDAYGQTAVCSSVVNQGSQIQISFDIVHNTCFGASAGSVDLTVNGGTAPYTFVWSNSATTSFIDNLPAGIYGCMVFDANGCSVGFNIEIYDGTPIVINSVVTDATVFGAADGSIALAVTGGDGVYTYTWSNGETTNINTGLVGGTYTVDVTDGGGCMASATYVVDEPVATFPLEVSSIVSTPVTCSGGTDGTVDLEVAYGNPPYTYAWSNGATTQDLTGVAGGLYEVTVTDGTTTVTANVTVDEAPAAMSYSSTVTNATSCQPDGSIVLSVAGGMAPYTYLWSTGATTADLVGVAGGSYEVTITDAYGCTLESGAIAVTADMMVISMFTTHNACFGDANGSALVLVTGGALPYSFAWSSGQTFEYIDGLTAGSYFVTVTDGNGCQSIAEAVITEPAEIIVQIVPNPIGLTASVVSGNVGAVTYLWSNNKPFQSIKGLTVGATYCVTVTDENGCIGTACAVYTGIFSFSKDNSLFAFGQKPKTADVDVADKIANINVYPNPTKEGKFFVDLSTLDYTSATLEVIDGYGKLVKVVDVAEGSDTQVYVEIPNASAGLYFIRAIYDNNVITKRLIITQ